MVVLAGRTSSGSSFRIHLASDRAPRPHPPVCTCRALMDAHDGAVDHVNVPRHLAGMISTFLNPSEQQGLCALLLPAIEPGTHCVPVPGAFRKVTPRTSRALDPEDAVEHGSVIQRGTSGSLGLRWEQWSQPAPLLIRQFVASCHTSFLPANGSLRTQSRG